ncbi:acyltransferase [Rhodococcus sp. WS4]|nr:acyltransferase [Rhodococcus sp. WS4]
MMAVSLGRRKAKRRTKDRRGFRADIQGLRAFAVIVVILDHLFHWPTGGFIGVDIFFVISGYLITDQLLRQKQRTGTISIAGFYRRRIRRIFPASFLALSAAFVASYFLFNHSRFVTTAWDSFWSLIFMSNWRFAYVSTDYFQADGPVSPLRHFWSLAVEEQFYFFWPTIMIMVFAIAARIAWAKKGINLNRNSIVGFALILIVVASVLWSAYETTSSPTRAYFSTLGRVWELGVGALIAVYATQFTNLSPIGRAVLSWLGLSGMVVSVFFITPSSPFPFPWAALPVLSAALFISAGIGGEVRFMPALTNPVAVYIGFISFSLYLWHFPVIVLMDTYFDLDSIGVTLATLGLIATLSIYAYHLVEEPILKSTWLMHDTPSGRKPGKKFSVPKPRISDGYRSYLVTFAVSMTVIAVILTNQVEATRNEALATRVGSAPISVLPPVGGEVEVKSISAPPMGEEGKALQAEIGAALTAADWPDLNPTLDYVVSKDPYPTGLAECGAAAPTGDCVWGSRSAPKSALLVGDSVAMKWAAGLIPAFGDGDWSLRIRAMFGCPFASFDPQLESDEAGACKQRKSDVVTEVATTKPDLVIIANTSVMPTLADSNSKATSTEWEQGVRDILQKVRPNAKNVVVLSPPPPDKDVKECYTPLSSPSSCVSQITSVWLDNTLANSRAAEASGSTFLDTRFLFCSERGDCPPFVARTPVKRDLTHITPDYAVKISPVLQEMLSAVGVV